MKPFYNWINGQPVNGRRDATKRKKTPTHDLLARLHNKILKMKQNRLMTCFAVLKTEKHFAVKAVALKKKNTLILFYFTLHYGVH